jgi:AcrR family transcriptional regulator
MVQKESLKRGRPRAYDPDKALRDAMALFWEHGYSATSLDALSAATGMNRPSLYAAFGDKKALYLKALASYHNAALAGIDRAFSAPSLRDSLDCFFGLALKLHLSGDGAQRGCLLTGTAAVESVHDPEIRAMLAQSVADYDARIEARLRLAREKGELSEKADPAGLARLVSAALYSSAVRARAGDKRENLEATDRLVVDLVCAQ